ncbi:unnamed protein product (macronuclear) [Paramecium tetraurelia]|uniref:H(+)-exporting diphosphatase n=1 Tax=Paramecium tetraurelia TaxID=5888 RepID=A0CBV0_PARTE|nr:uncharacterized protein GSPATT00037050001 [Paramecium tetraurelia]CAK68267.1 unnamed protein product [Paramecium tetraurelia]|eukprot:XP_001435664.1 hypothetical protein (macronuclear) [Paramecium tetraurelia strain d4-2]
MEFVTALVFIFIACACGIAWAIFNWLAVHKIEIHHKHEGLNEKLQGDQQEKIETLLEIGEHITDGAKAFLKEEYTDCSVFIAIMAVALIFVSPWSTLAFVLGAATSMLCGYLGMSIATAANYRTAFCAITSLSDAFQMAYRGGCVMGFLLVSISLSILSLIIIIYNSVLVKDNNQEDLISMFDYVAAYGLGGSTFALFGRVGGGIYTKAADVGADLVGKVEKNLPEDSPKNPATIADNVGDNVGDIAGMGADLFGSFAESTCAALVVSSTQLRVITEQGPIIHIGQLMYPLVVSAFGIIICIAVSGYAVFIQKVTHINKIESSLKLQLLLSTVAFLLVFTFRFQIGSLKPWHALVCSLMGLWSGLLIGYFTEYMTSHSYTPVREVAKACGTGAATNIIYGLALGYLSTIVPIVAIALTALLSMKLLSFYGVALAALGMLSNLTIGLAIDAYGPISDNAGGIAEMSELGEEVRTSTDALDAAGNTTAAIGKGFAIGSAALVSLSLYGGYLTRIQTYNKNGIDDPIIFAMLLIGAMLPYAFSAFTMKSVGKAALQMVEEVRRQLHEHPGIYAGTEEPDFRACIAISTKASLKEMIPPGLLVIVTPTAVGLLFGPQAVAGLLPGALISGVQMAISASNTGGAWDNAKKYIEAGFYKNDLGEVKKKGSDEHKAAVIGDTVGDPLKDTSGPSLNILIKLMAILSLVLAETFCKTGWLYKD